MAALLAVKVGTRIDLPPVMNIAFTQPRPKPWKIGRIARNESPSRTSPHVAACNASAMKLRLESTMPLGAPVVPPENRIAAGSCVVAGARGTAGCGARMSAANHRTRGSAGTARMRRRLVSQNPRLFTGDR